MEIRESYFAPEVSPLSSEAVICSSAPLSPLLRILTEIKAFSYVVR